MTREGEYLDVWFPPCDEDDFFLKVRIWSRWDQKHFERMIETATNLLSKMEESEAIDTERWDPAFTSAIDNLVMLMNHPGFLAENELGMSDDEYQKYILKRSRELLSISERYKKIRNRFQ